MLIGKFFLGQTLIQLLDYKFWNAGVLNNRTDDALLLVLLLYLQIPPQNS